jgi:hypothetical protein
MLFFSSFSNPGIFVLIHLIVIYTTERQEACGPVTHLVCSAVVIYNDETGCLNPSSSFIGSGPQNNVEGLLVSVSEFEPQAVFQGCICTGFSLTIWLSYLKIHRTVSLDPMDPMPNLH